jgi:hypothetical protein
MDSLRRLVWMNLAKAGLMPAIDDLNLHFSGFGGDAVPIYLVGGFVRSCLISLVHGTPVEPKDADIVVDADTLAEFVETLPRGQAVHAKHGGFLWQHGRAKIPIDIWQLEDTVCIKRFGLPVTLASLLDGVDINISRLAMGLHDGAVVIEPSCFGGIRKKVIHLDAKVKMDDFLVFQLARAVKLHLSTGFALSDGITELLQKRGSEIVSGETLAYLRENGTSLQTIGKITSFIEKLS